MKKEFNMLHVTYKPDQVTIALFNCCQYIRKDRKGKYVWEAYDVTETGVICRKKYLL